MKMIQRGVFGQGGPPKALGPGVIKKQITFVYTNNFTFIRLKYSIHKHSQVFITTCVCYDSVKKRVPRLESEGSQKRLHPTAYCT